MIKPGRGRYRGNLLLVEDDHDFVESLAEILTNEGYEVRTAEGGEQALEVVASFAADIALVDIRLGKGNGLTLIPQLKRILPQVVCIAMTAYAHLESAIEAVQQGAYDYIRKPIDVRDLLMVLQRALEKRRFEERLQQIQRVETVGNLASAVAHDFNNIVTAVMGYMDLLHEDVASGNGSKKSLLGHIEEVRRAGQRATAITRQLLLFVRNQVARPVPLDLNNVLEKLKKLLFRLIRVDIQIEIVKDPNLPSIHADPGRIEQVVVNLMINAGDAMERGGTLTIETKYDSRLEDRESAGAADLPVVLRICDTGCGMDQETAAKAFEPFFTTKEEGKGTGLGLWTVKKIVEESGGEVSINSCPQEGTAVEIRFPLSLEEAERDDGPAAKEESHDGGETILICDDNETVRAVMDTELTRRGYTVLAARDGREALQLYDEASGAVELLITDFVMPGLSGPELAKKLRDEKERLPVLFVSGYQSANVDGKEMLDPLGEFLQKPFPSGILLSRVRRLLDRSALIELK